MFLDVFFKRKKIGDEHESQSNNEAQDDDHTDANQELEFFSYQNALNLLKTALYFIPFFIFEPLRFGTLFIVSQVVFFATKRTQLSILTIALLISFKFSGLVFFTGVALWFLFLNIFSIGNKRLFLAPAAALFIWYISGFQSMPTHFWAIGSLFIKMMHDFSYLYLWGAQLRPMGWFLFLSFLLSPFCVLIFCNFKSKSFSKFEVLWFFAMVIVFWKTKERPFWIWALLAPLFNGLNFKKFAPSLIFYWLIVLIGLFMVVPLSTFIAVDSRFNIGLEFFRTFQSVELGIILLTMVMIFVFRNRTLSCLVVSGLSIFLFYHHPKNIFKENIFQLVSSNPTSVLFFERMSVWYLNDWLQEKNLKMVYWYDENLKVKHDRVIVPKWFTTDCRSLHKNKIEENQFFVSCQ